MRGMSPACTVSSGESAPCDFAQETESLGAARAWVPQPKLRLKVAEQMFVSVHILTHWRLTIANRQSAMHAVAISQNSNPE